MKIETTLHSFIFVLALMLCDVASGIETKSILGMGLDFGGEELGELVFDNGTSDTVDSHEGITFKAGVTFQFESSYEVETIIGYKIEEVTASNGKLSFNRIPIDLLFFSISNQHRFGVGFTYHTNTKYSCKVDGVCNFETEIKDVVGTLVQYDYIYKMHENSKPVNIGVRYTNIEYQPEAGGTVIDGSGIGLVFGVMF